jgi:hypothetical protein
MYFSVFTMYTSNVPHPKQPPNHFLHALAFPVAHSWRAVAEVLGRRLTKCKVRSVAMIDNTTIFQLPLAGDGTKSLYLVDDTPNTVIVPATIQFPIDLDGELLHDVFPIIIFAIRLVRPEVKIIVVLELLWIKLTPCRLCCREVILAQVDFKAARLNVLQGYLVPSFQQLPD